MKTHQLVFRPNNLMTFFLIFIFNLPFVNAQVFSDDQIDAHKPETELPQDIYWDIKAYMPNVGLIEIKAIDKDGSMYNVKAIQNFYDTNIINVKAIVNGEQLPIKLIVSDDDIYFPLKAIDAEGNLLDIKAVTDSGELLPIKGIGKSGNLVYIKVIGDDDAFYNVFAFSPEGRVNDVEGVKLLETKVETTINGVLIYAHVKALSQS